MYRESLTRALVEFFASTTVSAAIVETLAAGRAMLLDEILASVRDIRRMELPQGAVENSLRALEDAGIVSAYKQSFRLTDVGKELADELKKLYKPVG